VVEDGVVFHTEADYVPADLREPNLAYFEDLVGRSRVSIEEITDDFGVLAVQGPRSRALLASLVPGVETLPFFGLTTGSIAGTPVTVSRTGYSGDLGFEIWVPSGDALRVWDTLWETVAGHGVLPFGLAAWRCCGSKPDSCCSTSISRRAGSAGRTRTDRPCSSSAGAGWCAACRRRSGVHRPACHRARAGGQDVALAPHGSRARLGGIRPDLHDAGLIPPKDHAPVLGEMFVYDADDRQVGYTTSFMYSPVLQRHIALARVRPALAAPGRPYDWRST
jgi:aminomethyltransferase